ncbi:MAG TPA: histidine phosphatase family protein [Patescibacteria group bacterium]|nr:histidine phosphatase family protein [Patescibacteria group bacterium]
MAKIFLFRHGQTSDNKDKIFSGWRNVDLTPEGEKEAEKIAGKLRSETPTKAYASDLIRSQHTLQIVLASHPPVPTVIDPRIKERDYGNLTGKSKTELEEKDPVHFQLWHRSYNTPPPGGESIAMVEKRVIAFLQEMFNDMKQNDCIFISAHGNSIRPMRKHFEHLSNEEMCSYEYAPATVFSYTV